MTLNPDYGTETLKVLSEAGNFNRWMYETIKPYCSGKILEIGSGIGNISKFFLDDGFEITLSDINEDYFDDLNNVFGNYKNLCGVQNLDFSDPDLEKHHPELIGRFNTVFALNVLEHVPDHLQAVNNSYKLLKKGGRLIILVPAFQKLYNRFDEQLGHHRRYSKQNLSEVFRTNGFKVMHSQYFNFIAILGWFMSGTVLKERMIPGGQMKIYNALVPLWRVIDVVMKKIAGVSVIHVGEK
jgi:SAM-dependent methyltransferase